ncbi:MAG TPA: site-specific DNA-methyltransferase [Erysipelotrichaceae bacterium]|nr:site-specific DNA-methyltransferase [Erysipelotrichaceae bacterium]
MADYRYLRAIKLIYIDPPYNTGSDNFVYPDNYAMDDDEYETGIGLYDVDGNKLFKENNNGNPRFHSDWCSMLYSRLLLAKNLLSDDGVICIQIDDNEYDNLKKICDEVFGAANYMTTIVVKMSEATGMKMAHADMRIPKLKEYILVYTGKTRVKLGEVRIPKEKWDNEYKTYLENITHEEVSIIKSIRDNENRTLSDIKICDEILSKIEYTSLSDVYKKYNIKDSDKEQFNFQNAWRIVQTVSMTGGAKQLADKKRKEVDSLFYSIVTPQKKMYFIKGDYSSEIAKPRIKILFADDYLTVNPCDFWQDIKTTGLDNEGYVDFRNGKKPLKMMERIITLFTNKDDIVLDFFAGSGTTGQAIMEFNTKSDIKRRFILVQLPEDLDAEVEKQTGDSKKETQELIDYLDSVNRPHLLSEIGKERLLQTGNVLKTADVDKGFRVLKLDDSNMTDVYYNPDEYNQGMLFELESNIKPDRTDLDLLFGCLLEWGLPLSLPYSSEQIDGYTVHNYNDGDLIACFDENVPDSVIKEIAKKQPLRAVFRDSSFADSPSKINVGEIFKLMAPDTRVKVI